MPAILGRESRPESVSHHWSSSHAPQALVITIQCHRYFWAQSTCRGTQTTLQLTLLAYGVAKRVREINLKTAFSLKAMQSYKQYNKCKDMCFSGNILASELIDAILRPSTLHGKMVLSWLRVDDDDTVRVYLTSFVNDFVDVFPMRLLNELFRRYCLYTVIKRDSKTLPFPTVEDSSRLRQVRQLRQHRKKATKRNLDETWMNRLTKVSDERFIIFQNLFFIFF